MLISSGGSEPLVEIRHFYGERGVWCPALLTTNSAGAIVPPCGPSWTALAVLSSSACHDNNFESIVFDNDPSTGCNWGRNSDYLDLTNIFNVINGNLFSVVDLKKRCHHLLPCFSLCYDKKSNFPENINVLRFSQWKPSIQSHYTRYAASLQSDNNGLQSFIVDWKVTK